MIAEDNSVRVIDAFVDTLELDKIGFRHAKSARRGAPSFHPAVLLKIYLYGYLNRIRSSRKLEVECCRNIELMWLTERQQPCYHTIATFRSAAGHPKALREVFRTFNHFCRRYHLFGAELIAVDGSKFRAQNSMKNNFNEDKIERQCEYIDRKFEHYLGELDECDQRENTSDNDKRRSDLLQAMQTLIERKQRYETLGEQLEASGESQISTTDADARALPLHMGIVQVGYNIQSAVDAKYCLVAHFDTTNEKDDKALAQVATQAKNALGAFSIVALADKGYHSGAALEQCAGQNITTYVAQPDSAFNGKEAGFRKSDFTYNSSDDTYTCPQGKTLTSNGNWYEKSTPKRQLSYRFKKYSLARKVCFACPVKEKCCGSYVDTRHGKQLERTEFDPVIEANRRRMENNKALYRRRQAIVEHPFGTIKRSWGYTYTLLKGKEKVNGEFALIFTAYNLRRAMSILGVKEVIRRLKAGICYIWSLWRRVKRHKAMRCCLAPQDLWMADPTAGRVRA